MKFTGNDFVTINICVRPIFTSIFNHSQNFTFLAHPWGAYAIHVVLYIVRSVSSVSTISVSTITDSCQIKVYLIIYFHIFNFFPEIADRFLLILWNLSHGRFKYKELYFC